MVTNDLINHVLGEFRLKTDSFWGPAHWARVLVNGRLLAAKTGADLEVVELFAILHDARRKNVQDDPGHGKRSADFAESLRGLLFDNMSDETFNLLYDAIQYHGEDGLEGHPTLQTCWDADRLDRGRMRRLPPTDLLCTEAARDPELMNAAHQRATDREIPAFVADEWGINIQIKKKSSWF